jgi:membrane-associated phospholipid phosphatase
MRITLVRRRPTLCLLALLPVVFVGPVRGESPYLRSWSRDGWLAGGSTVAAAGAIAVSQTTDPLTASEIDRLSRESVNGFDRSATYNYSGGVSKASDLAVGIVAAVPLALMLDGGVRDDWPTCALMYAETMALAVILPAYGKGTVDRIRPFVYNSDAPMDAKTTSDARKSFFSRHTSAAFASAVFMATVYGDYHPGSAARPYVWAGSLLAATAVGIMRYESGEHFPTDVIVGAVAGSAAGYLVPLVHRSRGGRLSLRPARQGAQAGLILELKL